MDAAWIMYERKTSPVTLMTFFDLANDCKTPFDSVESLTKSFESCTKSFSQCPRLVIHTYIYSVYSHGN